MNMHTNEYIQELKSLSDIAIRNFWRFYFSGPHPNNYYEDYKTLHSKIIRINPKIALLMKQSYEKLLENDSHEH